MPSEEKGRYFASLHRVSCFECQNQKHSYIPTGNLLEVVDSMAGARYFSAFDLAHGYYQIPIAARDKEKQPFEARWDNMNLIECYLD
jgi:hypothetical protein